MKQPLTTYDRTRLIATRFLVEASADHFRNRDIEARTYARMKHLIDALTHEINRIANVELPDEPPNVRNVA